MVGEDTTDPHLVLGTSPSAAIRPPRHKRCSSVTKARAESSFSVSRHVFLSIVPLSRTFALRPPAIKGGICLVLQLLLGEILDGILAMMNITKQTCLLATVVATLVMGLIAPSIATDWPTRRVTILVPTAAGGNTDLMARLGAEHLSQKFGQTFIVENKPSAGGVLTSAQVGKAAPDGYTLLFAPSSMILLTPLVQKLDFDPAQVLTPVTNIGTGSQVAAIRRDLPVTTLSEFLTYAKANPGKLNFAIAGANNISHLGPALLFKRAGVDLVMVPASGEPQAISDLIAGNADFYFGNASILLRYANHEKIRLLAVGTAHRLAAAPELPTISETVPGFVFASWNGFFVPKGTPDDVVDKLRNELTAFTTSPATAERLTKLGILPGGMDKTLVEATFKADRQSFEDAVKAAGVQPQ